MTSFKNNHPRIAVKNGVKKPAKERNVTENFFNKAAYKL